VVLGSRSFRLGLQGALAADVAAAAVVAGGVGQVAGQDLPQPGRHFLCRAAAELRQRLVGLQQGLLHQVGSVEAGQQSSIEVAACQQEQVIAVTVQVIGDEGSGHGPLLG
jgi:hypothetical protein